jgi:hypothetical protein
MIYQGKQSELALTTHMNETRENKNKITKKQYKIIP